MTDVQKEIREEVQLSDGVVPVGGTAYVHLVKRVHACLIDSVNGDRVAISFRLRNWPGTIYNVFGADDENIAAHPETLLERHGVPYEDYGDKYVSGRSVMGPVSILLPDGTKIETSGATLPVEEEEEVEHLFNWGDFIERHEKGIQPIARHGISTESEPLRQIPVYRWMKVAPAIYDGASLDPKGDPFAPFPYRLVVKKQLGTDQKHGADLFSGDGRHIARFLNKQSLGYLPTTEMLFTARMMTRSFFFLALAQYAVPLWHRVHNGQRVANDEGLQEAAMEVLNMYNAMLEDTGIEDFGRYDEITAQVMAARRRPLGYFMSIAEDKSAAFIHLKTTSAPELSYRVAVLNGSNFTCYEEMHFTAKLLCASHQFASWSLDAITCLTTFYPPLNAYFSGETEEEPQQKTWEEFQEETGIEDPDVMLQRYEDALAKLYDGAPEKPTLYEPVPTAYDPLRKDFGY